MTKALTAAAVLALAMTAGVSSAGQSKEGTRVSELVAERFQGNPSAPVEISGRVASKEDACERGRVVTAYHDVLPAGPGPEDFRLGSDLSDKNGEFALSTQFNPDKVYVTVSKAKRKADGERVKCKATASKTVPVGSYT
jgi:hypothetical protein